MIYANKEVLQRAQVEAWKEKTPYYVAPDNNGKRSLETVPEGNYVPDVKGRMGISAGRFPSVKGADLFY